MNAEVDSQAESRLMKRAYIGFVIFYKKLQEGMGIFTGNGEEKFNLTSSESFKTTTTSTDTSELKHG